MKNIIFLILMIPTFCIGQIKINGIVKSQDKAVSFANVVLTDQYDKFITGEITDEQGAFEIRLEKGTYKLSVSHINYKNFEQTLLIEKDLNLDPIQLTASSTDLDEIVVTAKKSTIKREIDRTVINIENNLILQNSNLFDVLKSAPGLAIRNDAIIMLGKSNIRVAMNGRLIELSGEELNNFLLSISASDVKAIEVITNPPAKYEAEGNSGIVNIITKRIKKNSWRNNFSIAHTQAKYGRQAFNNNFSYQKNKLNLLAMATYNSGRRYIKQIIEPNYSDFPQKIISQQTIKLNNITPRVLLDYNINSTTTMGMQYLGYFSKSRQLDDLETSIFNGDFEINNYLIANDTRFDQNHFNSSYNFYFDKKLDTLGRNITLNFDILDYDGYSINDVRSEAFDADFNFLNIEFANLGQANYQVQNYNAKADVDYPLDWINLSFGMKSTFSKTNYNLDNFNTLSGEPVFNALQSNEFDFKENIHSTYINTSKNLNDQWEFQMGLRYEYTQIKGESKELDLLEPIFKNAYWHLFPTFYTKYTRDENNVFSLNYGKRINRPAYSQLNPARTFLSGQSSQLGNPYLSPSFSHNIEFTHTYKYNLSTTISYSHVSDAYAFIFELDNDSQQQTITYKNLFKENRASIMASYQSTFTPWWNARTLLFYSYSHSKKLNQNDNLRLMNGSQFYGSFNNQLTLNKAKTITGEVNFWYNSALRTNLYSLGNAYSLDLAISFKSLIKGMNVTIGGYDLLNSTPRTATSFSNNIEHNFIAFPSNRYGRITLSYIFGNERINTRERAFGNEDVRRRSQ